MILVAHSADQVKFPGYITERTKRSSSYRMKGCDWLVRRRPRPPLFRTFVCEVRVPAPRGETQPPVRCSQPSTRFQYPAPADWRMPRTGLVNSSEAGPTRGHLIPPASVLITS